MPGRPARRRGNNRRGHGNSAHDRPPVVGVVSRATGDIVLEVVERTDQKTLTELATGRTGDGSTVYADEWSGYTGLPAGGRGHATVDHTPGQREWARDGDADREVHDNTLKGLWAALRPFRGVSKHDLRQHAAVFQWGHNLKVAFPGVVCVLLGLPATTPVAS